MRLYFPIAIIAISLLCACTEQETDSEEIGNKLTLEVSIEDVSSKAAYSLQDNCLKCQWAAGDSISIISLHNGAVATVNIFTTESSGQTASFSGRFSGNNSDPVIAVYPALKGTFEEGYKSNRLPGNQGATFQTKKGYSSLHFSPGIAQVVSQSSNGDYSHISSYDLMTGTVDIKSNGGSVTLSKHSTVLKLELSIPDLTSEEKR